MLMLSHIAQRAHVWNSSVRVTYYVLSNSTVIPKRLAHSSSDSDDTDYTLDLISLKKTPKKNKDKEALKKIPEDNGTKNSDDFVLDLISLKRRPKQTPKPTTTSTNSSNISSGSSRSITKGVREDDDLVPKSWDVGNVKSKTQYNTKGPAIDELNRVINVSQPAISSKTQKRKLRKRNKALISELTQLNPDEKMSKIDDLVKIIESEIPKLSSKTQVTEATIEDKLVKLNELKAKIQTIKDEEARLNFEDDGSAAQSHKKELEGFLMDAKRTKEQQDQEYFRMSRAYEWSKNLVNKSPRSLEEKNFFTPIDGSLFKFKEQPKLISDSSGIFKPVNFNTSENDDLLFPRLKKQTDLKYATGKIAHEFLILANNKEIIVEENPLETNYRNQDLFTMFSNVDNPESYLKQISKLEKKGGWKLIGLSGDVNKILVFERFIDKHQDRTQKRKKIMKTAAISTISLFIILYGFGSYFERQQHLKSKYVLQGSKLVKESPSQ